jgi:hypothetical protein
VKFFQEIYCNTIIYCVSLTTIATVSVFSVVILNRYSRQLLMLLLLLRCLFFLVVFSFMRKPPWPQPPPFGVKEGLVWAVLDYVMPLTLVRFRFLFHLEKAFRFLLVPLYLLRDATGCQYIFDTASLLLLWWLRLYLLLSGWFVIYLILFFSLLFWPMLAYF